MVPKIHPKGRSFKGAAAYLLHDIEADTSERVAWTATKNLAVEDPEVAWRVMAATAMNADELKRQAGVKNTGRKSSQHVLHMTLSWHPDEGEELNPDEMLGSAEAALLALGASDRQALIVCHDDKDHAHVHVLVNRVSPEDGRMLSSSFERLKASEWAQKYEEARGQIFCHERVVNNAARKRGEYTRGEPNEPRHLHDLARRASNDNPGPQGDRADTEAKLREQRSKDYEVGKRARQVAERKARQWAKLNAEHKQRAGDIRREIKTAIAQHKDDIRRDFRPRWMELHHEQQAVLRAHELREDSRLGRVQNAVRAINFRGLMQSGERKKAISEAFQAFTDSGARLTTLKRDLEARNRELAREQKAAEDAAAAEQRAKQAAQLEANRRRYITERAELVLKQQMDQAAQRAAWKTRRQERKIEIEPNQDQETPRRDAAAQHRADLLDAFEQRSLQRPEPEPNNDQERDRD